jgi:hypothetical protein
MWVNKSTWRIIEILIIFMIVSYVGSCHGSRRHGSLPNDYTMHIIASFFMTIDYVTLLAENYTKSASTLPEGEMTPRDAVRLLQRADTIPPNSDSIVNYVRSKEANYHVSDLTSILANIDLFLNKEEGEPHYLDYGIGEYCFFEKSLIDNITEGKPEYLYIGFKINTKQVLTLRDEYHQELVKAISAMRENYYFQNTLGEPYQGGDVIITRISLGAL